MLGAICEDGPVFLTGRRHARVFRSTVWAAVLGLVLGILAALALATSAEAHTALRSVDPEDGGTVTTPPTEVVLAVAEPVSASFATVSVSGPGGSVSKGRAQVDGTVVTQPLQTGLANGRYTVSFRVVSQDGHPVSSRTTFTLVGGASPTSTSASPTTPSESTAPTSSPSTSTPVPTAAPSDDAAEDAGDDGRTIRIALAVAVAALAVAAGTAVVALTRRRHNE
jgi:methionine-rich copper-binding protein CopC